MATGLSLCASVRLQEKNRCKRFNGAFLCTLVLENCTQKVNKSGLSGGTRTPDLQLRRLLLYPVELRTDLVGPVGVEPTTNGL